MIRRPPRSTLFSLHDALPISGLDIADRIHVSYYSGAADVAAALSEWGEYIRGETLADELRSAPSAARSEEHTSELQSRQYLVCRLLLEKKKLKPMLPTLQHPY